MNTVTSILEAVYLLLSGETALSDIRFLRAYPDGFKQSPLTRSTVTVGFSAAELSPGGFTGYCGEDPETGRERYARRAAIKMKLELFIPKEQAGVNCAALFTRISDCLFAGELSGAIVGIEGGETAWNRQAGAYVLPVTLRLSAMLASPGGADDVLFDEIVVKAKGVN